MKCRFCCRPLCFCLCKVLSTFFMLVGVAAVVFCLSLFQVRELSRLASHDYYPYETRSDLFHIRCKPCSEKNVTHIRTTRDCGKDLVMPSQQPGTRLEIRCDSHSSRAELKNQTQAMVPFKMPFKDPCLERYILEHCYDGLKVPKVVHYVWFSKHPMDIYAFLSVLSAAKFLEPCVILFHADYLPFGPYWKKLLMLVNNIIFVQRNAPERIFGRRLGFIQHQSDIARIQALKELGGIYLDCDQFVLKNFDYLRNFDFVMGHENSKNLGNSIMVSIPDAVFLDIWFDSYRTYNPSQWGIHSTFVPFHLAQEHPSLIHIENDTLITPDLGGIEHVYSGRYNWTNNYAIHLYSRWVKKSFTINQLRTMDTTLGEIARLILYGSPTLCSN